MSFVLGDNIFTLYWKLSIISWKVSSISSLNSIFSVNLNLSIIFLAIYLLFSIVTKSDVTLKLLLKFPTEIFGRSLTFKPKLLRIFEKLESLWGIIIEVSAS